ncbi:MAG: EF-hand domain-containing protein [Taibaiella sp.]|nr:EF-hand domain-containing protein [Taibaiella sp.]
MKQYISMLVIILAINNPDTTIAQQKGRGKNIDPDKVFEKLDTDKDGKINKEEVEKADRPRLKENFSKIDADSDGFISKEEFKRMVEKRREATGN